jgi:enamine deaminase RidA (YjgF/YER057c/UK114 family)
MNRLAKLKELGFELPEPAKPVGSYVPAVQSGKLIFTAGQLPLRDGKLIAAGKVPTDVPLDLAGQAAAQACLNALAAVVGLAGSLEAIGRVVRLNCFVNSARHFIDQAKVANSASQLLTQILGDDGVHTRCAVGVAELPLNAPVELDLIVEVK